MSCIMNINEIRKLLHLVCVARFLQWGLEDGFCEKLPPCPIKPMPGISKLNPLLAKAEPMRNGDSPSGIKELRREKNWLWNSSREKRVKMWGQVPCRHHGQWRERWRRRCCRSGAQIPLHPAGQPVDRQRCRCSPWRTTGRQDPPTAYEASHSKPGGSARRKLTLWEAPMCDEQTRAPMGYSSHSLSPCAAVGRR